MAKGVTISLETIKRAYVPFLKAGPAGVNEQDKMRRLNKSLMDVRFEAQYSLSDSERESAKRKGLTHKQWKLRELYRWIFEEEFYFYKENLFLNEGITVSYAGLTLKERMDMFSECAETALNHWAEAIGVVEYIAKFKNALPVTCQSEYFILTSILQIIE